MMTKSLKRCIGMNFQDWCKLDESDERKINYILCGFWDGAPQTVSFTSEDSVDYFRLARVQMSTIEDIRLEDNEWLFFVK